MQCYTYGVTSLVEGVASDAPTKYTKGLLKKISGWMTCNDKRAHLTKPFRKVDSASSLPISNHTCKRKIWCER
ncbi:hypothetical protein BT96DRAFT_189347 [Gymnopus androsaceus JB14]|uniref:Uncharacterized protein n=1 Tax=Gymnopus androsaceus JB14 TaxID=1447944 RepID=A0A6A4HAY1_9AGAR|nr:hypothetical protein BT96DRAFT_189347 [Gymnopus androsaceus JB14]